MGIENDVLQKKDYANLDKSVAAWHSYLLAELENFRRFFCIEFDGTAREFTVMMGDDAASKLDFLEREVELPTETGKEPRKTIIMEADTDDYWEANLGVAAEMTFWEMIREMLTFPQTNLPYQLQRIRSLTQVGQRFIHQYLASRNDNFASSTEEWKDHFLLCMFHRCGEMRDGICGLEGVGDSQFFIGMFCLSPIDMGQLSENDWWSDVKTSMIRKKGVRKNSLQHDELWYDLDKKIWEEARKGTRLRFVDKNGRGYFSKWVKRVCANFITDVLRKEMPHKEIYSRETFTKGNIELLDEFDEFKKEWNSLTDEEKQLIWMIGDDTKSLIAEKLGRSQPTIRKMIASIQKKLKINLGK